MQPPTPFVEPTERRVRVRLGNRFVADSGRAVLLSEYGPGRLPTYFLPREDVAPGALVDQAEAPDGRTTWTVRTGRRRAEAAAWEHPAPTGGLAALAGLVTFSWDALEWFEEDERVYVHARDPYHRVDTLRSSRRVEVYVEGELVARSIRPLLLFETRLPTRYYLPFQDVRTELIEASDLVTMCPFKGVARYWSVRVGDHLEPDLLWSYPDPIPENPKVKDLVSFFNERVDLVVDGRKLDRPITPWSPRPKRPSAEGGT